MVAVVRVEVVVVVAVVRAEVVGEEMMAVEAERDEVEGDEVAEVAEEAAVATGADLAVGRVAVWQEVGSSQPSKSRTKWTIRHPHRLLHGRPLRS